ncbi:MAG TPA: hypothetical protein VE989_01545 [Sphingomicrobium sp.]|nr:hypothetical protein [Sphingomicrobium sp.]
MRLAIWLASACLGLTTAAAVAAKDPPAPAEDKIICKRQGDADTGSHFAMPKRVCLRKSEWRQMEEGAENALRRIREQGGACPKCLVTGSGGGPG